MNRLAGGLFDVSCISANKLELAFEVRDIDLPSPLLIWTNKPIHQFHEQ